MSKEKIKEYAKSLWATCVLVMILPACFVIPTTFGFQYLSNWEYGTSIVAFISYFVWYALAIVFEFVTGRIRNSIELKKSIAIEVAESERLKAVEEAYLSQHYRTTILEVSCQGCGKTTNLPYDLSVEDFNCKHCDAKNRLYLTINTVLAANDNDY
jgi:ribosomal protein S27E